VHIQISDGCRFNGSFIVLNFQYLKENHQCLKSKYFLSCCLFSDLDLCLEFQEPVHSSAVVISPEQHEMTERVSTMTQWCRRLGVKAKDVGTMPSDRLNHFLVDRKHKLLFCQIPGVAQNDWRRIFIFLTGKVKDDPLVVEKQ
jgi:hypothetical protein